MLQICMDFTSENIFYMHVFHTVIFQHSFELVKDLICRDSLEDTCHVHRLLASYISICL